MSRYITRDYKTYNTIIKDCPIILKKTRILFDKETNLIILQIAINNLSSKEIKKINFTITTYNLENEIIDKEKTIVIEEKIKQNSEYSIKKTIIFKSKNINYINVTIKEVIYTDNLIWHNTKNKLEKEINKPNIIYTNSDLYKTLCFNKIKFNKLCYPEFNDNYWRCSCKTLNIYSESNCKLCNTQKKELENFFEYSKIENLVSEYKQQCIEKKEQKQKEFKQKNLNFLKIVKIILILIPIIVFLLWLGYITFNKIIYKKALNLYNEHKYRESITILEKYNIEYSKELLSDAYYSYGIYLLESEEYTEAIKTFKKTNHQDKELSINEARYRQGLNFLEEGYYFSALNAFENITINNYKETEKKIKETNYLIALDYIDEKNYSNALDYFEKVKGYKNANYYIEEIAKAKNYKYSNYYIEPIEKNINNKDETSNKNEDSSHCGVYVITIPNN